MGKTATKVDGKQIPTSKFESARKERERFKDQYVNCITKVVIPAFEILISEFKAKDIDAILIEAPNDLLQIIKEDGKYLKNPSLELPYCILKIMVPGTDSTMYAYVLKGGYSLMMLYILDSSMSKVGTIHVDFATATIQSFKGLIVNQFIKLNSKYRLW